MFTFTVTVDGVSYPGIYASSFDAVLDAMDRFPNAQRITAHV